jgi:hypothetical protein
MSHHRWRIVGIYAPLRGWAIVRASIL